MTIADDNWNVQLATLPDNWDSYGAKAVTHAALQTVGSFSLIPCGNSGVQVEIHQDGWDIEIVIEPSGKISAVLIGRELSEVQE